MNQVNESARGLPTTRDFIWAAVVQDSNGTSYLVPVRLSSRDDGERAFKRIQERLDAVLPRSPISRLLAAVLMRRVASTATIKYATKEGHREDILSLLRVYLEDEERDAFLTEAMETPELLRGCVSCLETYRQFLLPRVGTSNPFVGQRALVIGTILDKTKIARLLILLLIISPALGVFVGIRCHRADVGAAVSAGVFALAAFLQGLAARFQR